MFPLRYCDKTKGQTSCGKCQVCGEPGHTCHYPGSLPYTGSWCDKHFIDECREQPMVYEHHGKINVDSTSTVDLGKFPWKIENNIISSLQEEITPLVEKE